jgi:nicotinate-nucleotide adenylyltransferase
VAKIGIFGGTFDPVHRGHMAVARAALRRLKLDKLYFIPAGVSPHKRHRKPQASFAHRVAMLKRAIAGERKFAISRLEARGAHYSIDTVRRMKHSLKKGDRLFFVMGMDAFRDLASWWRAEELVRECEFAVAARPGTSLARVARALPRGVRPGEVRIHLLRGVRCPVSATAVRAAARRGGRLEKLVPPAVAEHIASKRLYRR